LKDKVKYVENKWNLVPHLNKDFYPVLPNIEDICIIHYAGYKPWESGCIDKFYIEEFWKYFCLTPYFQEDIGKYIDIMINQKINALDNKIKRFENKLIDTLAWWIPIRKWRDNFRNKFFDNFMGGGGVNNGFKFLYPLCFRLDLNY